MENPPQYRRSIALVIGINTYRSPKFPPLANAEEDSERLAAVLRAAPYSFEVYQLLGRHATLERIINTLHHLEQEARQNDRILVTYAGHGFTVPDRFESETGYLTAYDTDPNNHHTALKMSDVTDLRRYAHAKHIGFIFDACFSGQALGITRSYAVPHQLMTRSAFQVISAGAADQTVADTFSMTDHLVSLLTNPTDMLTMNRLGLRIQQHITQLSQGMQIPQFGHITGSEGGDMVLYAPQNLDTFSPLPERLRKGLRDANASVRYFAIAELEHLLGDPQLEDAAQATLEQLATNDTDVEVRRRALHALTRYYSRMQGSTSPPTPLTEITPAERPDTRPLRPRHTHPRLILLRENNEEEIPLRGSRFVLGRSAEADIHLEDAAVSRRHALLIHEGGNTTLEDLHSTNGTFVNGEPVNRPVSLHHGDLIQLAHTHLRFYAERGTDTL